jgi:FkbM family methyltransferase
MKKRLLDLFLRTLSKVTGKHVTYISSTFPQATNLAAKSKYGFWYCGNVFDQSDIAYGIANQGTVEAFDSEVVKNVVENLKPENDFVFYDVGANTGWYTMLASTVSTKSTVHSFEPLEEHLACLRETIFLNRKETQHTVHAIALSDTNGEAEIRLAGSGSSLEKNFLDTDRGVRKITVKVLDAFFTDSKIAGPDFIKIDVEGHEYKVLRGGEKVLREHAPVLFVEIAYSLKNIGGSFINENYEKTFEYLAELGYEPYLAKDNKLTRYEASERVDGVNMFLFLNKKKHFTNNVMIKTLGLL